MKEHAETSLAPFNQPQVSARFSEGLTPLLGALLLLHLHCCQHRGFTPIPTTTAQPGTQQPRLLQFSTTPHCVSHDGGLWGWIWGQTGGLALPLLLPPLFPPSLSPHFSVFLIKIRMVVLSRHLGKSNNWVSVYNNSPSTFPASSYSRIRDFLRMFSKALFQISPWSPATSLNP